MSLRTQTVIQIPSLSIFSISRQAAIIFSSVSHSHLHKYRSGLCPGPQVLFCCLFLLYSLRNNVCEFKLLNKRLWLMQTSASMSHHYSCFLNNSLKSHFLCPSIAPEDVVPRCLASYPVMVRAVATVWVLSPFFYKFLSFTSDRWEEIVRNRKRR